MKIQLRGILALGLFALVIPVFSGCARKVHAELQQVDPIDRRSNLPMVGPINRDLSGIKEAGTLTVLAPYNATTYFIYRGEPLGYEYELLQSFAKDQGLTLKMVVVTDPKSLFTILNSGEGDIAANRLVPTGENEADVSFTRALSHCARACATGRTTCKSRQRHRENAGARARGPDAGGRHPGTPNHETVAVEDRKSVV